MFNIIQVVHHDDGKNPQRYTYTSFNELLPALDWADVNNKRSYKRNMSNQSIAITYHVEYS